MFNGNGIGLDIGSLLGGLVNRNNGNGDGAWGGGWWWAIIILFALLGGWDNGGIFGNRGGSNAQTVPATAGDLQRGFDNQTVVNKLNGLESGLCSLGYDQLAQMNNIGQTISNSGYETRSAIQQGGFNTQLLIQQLTAQLYQCCCEIKEAIGAIGTQLAADTCNITNAITQTGQAIMQNDNANYRALHDELVDMKMQAKDETIAQLRSQLSRCDNRADLAYTAQQIEQYVRPNVVPAIPVNQFYGGGNCQCGNQWNNACNNGGWFWG